MYIYIYIFVLALNVYTCDPQTCSDLQYSVYGLPSDLSRSEHTVNACVLH